MDPVLTFLLLIAIVAALVYFYFWIRILSKRVERENLNGRLEELEQSVADTTRWLETTSDQIRLDLDRRMTQLKDLMASAENSTDRSISDLTEVVSDQDRSINDGSMEQSRASKPFQDDKQPEAKNRLPARSTSAKAAAAVTTEARHEAPKPESEDTTAGGTESLTDADPARGSTTTDTRQIILQLTEQGISIPEIAKRIDSSRSEVELVVAFQKSH